MIALHAELFLALCADDLDDAAFDDVRRIARYEAVDHTGAPNQPDLADGERQERAFGAAVQLAAAHHLREAVGLAKLLFQFLLIEPLSLEGVDRHGLRRKGIAALGELRQKRYPGRAARKLFQPERILKLRIPLFPDTQHSHLFEFLELTVGKAPDGESVKIVHENAADIRRQAIVGDNVDQQPAVHQRGNAFDQKPFLVSGAPTVFVDD